jgi:hypothetical protein
VGIFSQFNEEFLAKYPGKFTRWNRQEGGDNLEILHKLRKFGRRLIIKLGSKGRSGRSHGRRIYLRRVIPRILHSWNTNQFFC